MELVIKLDEETYKEVIDRTENDTLSLGIKLIEAVQNGTQLPKGHGDLKDMDNIQYTFDLTREDVIYSGKDVERAIKSMTTIIKADKEYEAEVITRGNCMMCGKELTEGLFFCKECENKANSRK